MAARGVLRERLRAFFRELTLREISGACGDLGTFIPLTVGLVKTSGLDLGTTLIFTGCYNIITGVAFGIPMPVQPMKTIAAVALSSSPLTIPQIMAAGMFVSASVLGLGLTRMMGLAQSLIPMAVIKGMQLGLGLDLARKGFQQVWYINSKSSPARGWWGVDGLFLGLFALLFILLSVFTQRDASPPAQLPLLPTATPAAAAGTAGVGQGAPQARAAASAASEGSEKLEAELSLEGRPVPENGPSHKAASGGSPGTQPQLPSDLSGVLDEAATPRSSGSGSGSDGDSRSGGGGWSSRSASSQDPMLPPAAARRRRLDWGAGARQRVLSWLDWLERQMGYSVGGGRATSAATEGPAAGGGCGTMSSSSRGFQVPAALLIVVMGVVMTLVSNHDIICKLRFGPSKPQIVVPTGAEWRAGILRAGLPQLSLTTFNSVISVCQLAGDLFPDRPASPNSVAASVGAMNLVGGWFGAMPACHGAGGLAAQVRFGATTGAAPIFLGLVKLALGLLFGSSLFLLLQSFPQPLMGSMLVYAGIELATVARNQKGERGLAVMLLTAATSLAMANVAIGVVAGLIAAYSLLACDLLRARALPCLRAWVLSC